jgi:uncharacterized membrane protein (Fun14 family)
LLVEDCHPKPSIVKWFTNTADGHYHFSGIVKNTLLFVAISFGLAGKAARLVFKIVAIITRGLLLLGTYLQHLGIIKINYLITEHDLHSAPSTTFHTLVAMVNEPAKAISNQTGNNVVLARGVGFTAGFMLAIRK